MSSVDYTPPPTVDAFIKSETFYNFIVGPVGSGKTVGSLFKILYHAMRQAPSPTDGIRRTRWVIVRNTQAKLKDTTMKSFFSWFAPGPAGTWIASDFRFEFRFADVHCEVMFRPLDTPDDVGRALSLEVTGVIIDEFIDIPKEVVEALAGRCGRFPAMKDGGATWWGMWGASNPGNEDNWWYSWLYDDWAPADLMGREGPGYEAKTKDEMFTSFLQPSGLSPQAENIENLPGGVNYYYDLAVGKSVAWIRQFIEVQWGYSVRGKPVYNLFREDLHVAKKPIQFNPLLPLIIGMDAGLTPAAIFGQQDIFGRVLILAELVEEDMGAKRFCKERILPLLNRRFADAQEVVVALDPAAGQRAQTDEKTVQAVVRDILGVNAVLAYDNRFEPRKESVDEYLKLLTDMGPGFLIDPACKVLIRGFATGYRYDINRKGVKDERPTKNQYSHPHDACQYLCMEFQRFATSNARRRNAQQAIQKMSRTTNVYSAR